MGNALIAHVNILASKRVSHGRDSWQLTSLGIAVRLLMHCGNRAEGLSITRRITYIRMGGFSKSFLPAGLPSPHSGGIAANPKRKKPLKHQGPCDSKDDI
jgi:hypothetical protein